MIANTRSLLLPKQPQGFIEVGPLPENIHYFVAADGGTQGGNPGRGYYSYVVANAIAGKWVFALRQQTNEVMTNNQTEYLGIINGLERVLSIISKSKAISSRSFNVLVRSDSNLVIQQMRGEYRVNDSKMKPLHQRTLDACAQFHYVYFEHWPRDNSVALFGH